MPSQDHSTTLSQTHDEKAYDTEQLAALGRYLAKDMGFDLMRAQAQPVQWYREQIGEELCSFERGVELRAHTAAACRQHLLSRPRPAVALQLPRVQMGIVPAAPSPTTPLQRAVAAVLVVGVVLLCVWAAHVA